LNCFYGCSRLRNWNQASSKNFVICCIL